MLNLLFITLGALVLGIHLGWPIGLGIWLIAVSIAPGS